MRHDAETRDGAAKYLLWGLGVTAAAVAGYTLFRYLGREGDVAPALGGGIYLLEGLASSPFPQQAGTGAAVVVPPGFVPSSAMRVCLYIRGFSNCVDRVVTDTDGPCSPGGATHHASHLATQLADSGSGTLLILPELIREVQSGDPGKLAQAGSVNALLEEVLARMAPVLGSRTVADIAHLGVMTHSGGYQTAAAIIRQRPAALRSVALLDSLYGNQADFAAWVAENAARFTPADGFRIADMYTDGGGTADKSRALAAQVRLSLAAAGAQSEFLFDDDASRTLTPQDYARHALFKHSALSHDGTTRYYPQRLWAAGW